MSLRIQLEFPDVTFNNITHENVLILDSLRTPGNIGMLLRSAVAFGFKKVIHIGDDEIIISTKVKKSARSAFDALDIIQKNNIEEEISNLKVSGYTVVGIELTNDSLNITDYVQDINTKYAFILGNERNGISSEALQLCDFCLHININPQLSSINVANAGAIVMFHFFSHLF